jgi:hypothetical protein
LLHKGSRDVQKFAKSIAKNGLSTAHTLQDYENGIIKTGKTAQQRLPSSERKVARP